MVTRPYHSCKYSLDEKFFDKWSGAMAYVLGFWFADGYMRHEKSYRIVFISNDRNILRQIRRVLGASHPITDRKTDRSLVLSVFSKRLYQRLAILGGLRRKSRTVRFPRIPDKYLKDFIRGYFDGDGSVFFVNYISTKNGKPRRELRSNFTSGSKLFLDGLMDALNQRLGLAPKKLGSYNLGRSLKLGYGTHDTKKLLKFIYSPDFSIGLRRKASFVRFCR